MKRNTMIVICVIIQLILAPKIYGHRDKDAQKSVREANRAFKEKDHYSAILHSVEALNGKLNEKGFLS